MSEPQKPRSVFKTVAVLMLLLIVVAAIVGVLAQNIRELG